MEGVGDAEGGEPTEEDRVRCSIKGRSQIKEKVISDLQQSSS